MKYIHRFFSYVARRLVIFTAVAALLILAFYLAMNTANIYLLLNDGMTARAAAVLTREDADELPNFFTNDFLLTDETLNIGLSSASPYIDYNITDFEYSLTIEKLWAWPWDNYANCTVVERVPSITGKVISSRKSEVSERIPGWQGGRYDITLMKVGGRWKIVGMQQKTILVEPEKEKEELETEILLP